MEIVSSSIAQLFEQWHGELTQASTDYLDTRITIKLIWPLHKWTRNIPEPITYIIWKF